MPAPPDYKKIYRDILQTTPCEKYDECKNILNKPSLSFLDVLQLDEFIFGPESRNQKYKSYNRKTIFEILDYQQKHRLNNTQVALHFNLSRNSVAKWKKIFF